MKHNFKKLLLPLALLVVVPITTGCSLITNLINGGNSGNGGSTQKVENKIDYDKATDKVKDYYKTVDIRYKKGVALQQRLHELMWKTHTTEMKYSQFSSKCATNSQPHSIENIPNTKLNQMFYTGEQVSGYPSGYTNREHVWPAAKSHLLWDHKVLTESSQSGGSDLYHVRMASANMNTARGDAPFVDFDDNTDKARLEKERSVKIAYDKTSVGFTISGGSLKGNYYTFASFVEVDDSFKGDVARILAYVWLHYNNYGQYTPVEKESKTTTLNFTDVVGFGTRFGYDEKMCMQTLLKWNKLDPVSEVEYQRNETVQVLQGNRNPFVDFPELMTYCFNLK